jgi:hypothetical protein
LNTDVDTFSHQTNIENMISNEVQSLRISIYFLEDIDPAYKGFIWLENGFYKGMGRIPSILTDRPDEIRNHLIRRYSSATTEVIMARLKEEKSPDLEFNQTMMRPEVVHIGAISQAVQL